MSNQLHRSTRTATPLLAALTLAWAPAAALSLMPATLAAQQSTAQTGRITGTVTGDAGLPVVGAQVTVVGTQLGTLTGDDGRYTIVGVPSGNYQIQARRIGFVPALQPVIVAVDQATTADFQLRAAATTLSTQVVVGYTTQQRRDVSDATAGVTAEQIADQKVATVEESLRGRIPGVQIAASGEPGRPAQVIIRGQNVLGNPSPLYVVDGMYMQQNPNLNPNDIESIEVLKDASAAAQYGAQAANGVIVIRTRHGRSGENRIQLRSYYGYQEVPKRIDLMNAKQWAQVQQQAYLNAGQAVPTGVTAALAGTSPSTDWQDAVFQRGGIQNHDLEVSGGTPNANYLISGGYLDQTGSIIETSFNRYSFRANSEARKGILQLGENIAISQTNKRSLNNAPDGGLLNQVVRMLPTIPIHDTTASGYGYGSGANPTYAYNPVALQQVQPRNYRSNQVIGSAFGEVTLFGPLHYRLNLGVNYNGSSENDFNSISQLRYQTQNQYATLIEARNNWQSFLVENLLTLNQTYGANKINAVAGYTAQRSDFDSVLAARQGYNDENLRTIDAGSLAGLSNGGPQVSSRLLGLLGRASYSFRDRYLLTGSIRRDGSSRFGSNNKYGTFGAISAGWVLSEEGFFGNVPGVRSASFVKLRGSVGVLGNQDIGDYSFSSTINQNQNYIFGGGIQGGSTQLNLSNRSIRWQSTRQKNIGLDIGAMDDRLTITADYYQTTPTGLLVGAPIPPSLGAFNSPVVNAGKMKNAGLELGIIQRHESGDFQLNTSATLTTARNRVLSLGNGGQPLVDFATNVARTTVGQPLGTFYVLKTQGIFQSDAEVQAYTDKNGKVIQPNAKPGDIRYADVNGDGQITLDDRYAAGNGTPKVQGGLFFDGKFRKWDFGLNLRGAGGFKIFNGVKYWTDRLDDPSNHRAGYAPWTPENHSNTTPRALSVGTDNTQFFSDRWIENGRYLRIQNVILGYTLPAGFSQRTLRTDVQPRVYVNLQNLHTFTKYSNWDPETLGFGDPLGRGIDFGLVYPNVRTVTFGLDLKL